MTTIALDDKTASVLANEKELVAMTDAAGTVIGYFAPLKQEYADQYAEMAARAHSIWGPNGPPRRSMTTTEVIELLESLEKK